MVLVIEVVARQFAWQFRYPEHDLVSQELHLPVDQPVRFEITSDDVIHSFWVPQFRAKRDATPGQISELSITPTELGRYPIRCAELCGVGHAIMNAEVIVETQADFLAWIEAQASLPSDPMEAGRLLFNRYGCQGCHALDDAGAVSVVGPALEAIGEVAEERVADLDARGYLEQSILDPGAYVVDGYQDGLMPLNFAEQISADELRILVDYLLAQR
jgi:cytochrome c oxidase subunit II